VRRFNETFQQLFGRPPGELRRIHKAETPAADGITCACPTSRPKTGTRSSAS
jgi:AraC family transcriptional regulator of adaptative response / DNA-3-methyladenine glycosylase II